MFAVKLYTSWCCSIFLIFIAIVYQLKRKSQENRFQKKIKKFNSSPNLAPNHTSFSKIISIYLRKYLKSIPISFVRWGYTTVGQYIIAH